MLEVGDEGRDGDLNLTERNQGNWGKRGNPRLGRVKQFGWKRREPSFNHNFDGQLDKEK